MRKNIFLIFVVLLCSGPALAGVTVEATFDGNEVTIGYQMDPGDPNLPRAFALDISLSQENGAQIGPVYALSSDYWVYPGSIDINEATGAVDSNGTPVALSDGNSMTIEMGSLYHMGTDPSPASSGVLLKFRVSADCTVSLAENAARSGADSNGVVMEDTTMSFAKSYVTLVSGVGNCACGPTYPACWDSPTQCHGDVSSVTPGVADGVVDTTDWPVFRDGFAKCYPDPDYIANACGDYNRDGCINTEDWPEFRDNFPGPIPANCAPGDPCGIFN